MNNVNFRHKKVFHRLHKKFYKKWITGQLREAKVKCYACGKEGHVTNKLFQEGWKTNRMLQWMWRRRTAKKMAWLWRGELLYCLEKSLYCPEELIGVQPASRKGVIEGKTFMIDWYCFSWRVLLDYIMVHGDPVQEEKRLDGEAITVTCAHRPGIRCSSLTWSGEGSGANRSPGTSEDSSCTDVPGMKKLL